jgi:hypothetical protein
MSMADRHEHLQRGAISRRRFLRGAAVSGGVLLAGPTLWQQTARASVPPMSPHLQVGADPRSTMVVSRATSSPVARPVVDVGLDDGFGRSVAAETRTVAGTSTHYHPRRRRPARPRHPLPLPDRPRRRDRGAQHLPHRARRSRALHLHRLRRPGRQRRRAGDHGDGRRAGPCLSQVLER